MLPTNDQTQNTNNPEIPIFLPVVAHFYLTFNIFSTIYQAYAHGDFPMVAFIVFVYLAYFFLMYCMTLLQALPPQDRSPRKDFLKSVIWVLTSVIFFGFAYQFSTFIHPVAAAFVFALAILASAFIFFLYFVYDGQQQQQQQQQKQSGSSTYRLRIHVLGFSPSTSKVCDSKIRQVVPGPENV
ncbi:PREDICTED: uncharacterized protein LOC18601442 [Theobroma cacao]|uniref:Uncharacterized protein LOC18601442 n=1 Tax=Theobroma cacao TaxID=3641 RepID=A0AB32V683_THECC|nr:PREDICTED: uncharacterized protein LOC18601442 [Theobroma cacao]